MTVTSRFFASIFIVSIALSSTLARGDSIYKCGSTYSQTPCPQGQQLSVDDSREPTQKKLADEKTRRDGQLANALEKDRLEQERKAKLSSKLTPMTETASTSKASEAPSDPPLTKITLKRLKTKTYKPAGFVAQVPDTAKQADKAKKTKKTKN